MLTQWQANVLRESILKEMLGLDIEMMPENLPYSGNYYLVIFREGRPYFVVRSEQQRQERRRLLRSV